MKITNKMRSRLFRMAHAISSKFSSFSQALAHAWKIIKLQSRMMVGNVRFSYYKVSGELREAVGTLSVKMEVKGTGRPSPVDSFLYYDIDKKSFRSCKVYNIF